jgi:hypothetical protein
MPKPRVLPQGLRSCARPLGRGAVLVSIAALVAWPVAVGASDLTTGVLPPAPERLRGAIDRTVGDAKAELRKSIETGSEIVNELQGAVQEALGDDGGVSGADPATGAETTATQRRDEREVQAEDGRKGSRGDVDDLVASGDEIGADRVQGRQVSRPLGAPAEALPFTGFDPARLLLAGATMILSGIALLTSGREGRARFERAA